MKISLTSLTTVDLATLAARTIEASEKGKYTIIEHHPLLERVKEEYAEYKKVYSKLTSSGMGKNVYSADEERDTLFVEIRHYLQGVAGLRRAPGKTDAVELLKVFEQYGSGMYRMSYSTESAQLNKLLMDLEKPENTTHIAALKLGSQLDELKEMQQSFEKMFGEQSEANADLREIPSASSVRRSLETALRSYFDLLEAMKDVEGWEMIYLDVSEIVKAAVQSHRTEEKTQAPSTKYTPGNLGFRRNS